MTSLNYLAASEQSHQTKQALVLSGGGMRLSYQAGVMLALQEAGMIFSYFDATSGGSINMSMLLSGLSPWEMCQRWASLKMKDSLSLLPIAEYLDVNKLEGLGDADGIRQNVFPHLGIDIIKIQAVSNVSATYNVLDYAEKQVAVIPHAEIDEDMMIAGISLPGVFPPVRKNNKTYLDTAFIQDANLMQAVKQGAEEIWLIWGLGNTAQYRGGALNIYIQMLETSANGALNNEILQIQRINQRILNGNSEYGQQNPIRLHMIKPERPLPLDPDLYLGKINNQTLIDMGYADASAYLNNIPDNGLVLGNNMTRMIEPEPGLRFCEEPKGNLVFNENPQGGKATSLELTVHIQSFEKFMSNPDQPQRVTGRVSVDGWVNNKIIEFGQFSVMVSGDSRQLKILNYKLKFSVNEEKYVLFAKKELFDDPGFDLYQDLSSVYVELYKGSNLDMPVAGGGLKLSAKALASQVASIRPTHSDSLIDSAKMVTQFCRFCLLHNTVADQLS